jgi:hypothetical protein
MYCSCFHRNYYGQQYKWCDMNGKCTTKEFRPPVKPSFPTFSMWHDIDNNGAFGGTLGGGSPYTSLFRWVITRRMGGGVPACTSV